jgi:S1-C subfamily serine protease
LYLSRKQAYVSIILIIVLVTSVGGLAILYLNLNKEYSTLQSEIKELKFTVDLVKSASNRSGTPYGLTPQQLYDLVKPSVVKITVKIKTGNGLVPQAQGSGFIYSKGGFIVTNNHVVNGADAIEVTFPDGIISKANLVGADPYSDLAVIRVAPNLSNLQPLLMGNSSGLKVGDLVFAIGNPFGLSGSMTEGIVSQLDRTLNTEYGYLIVGVVQTDAAINPGNSGGPLLNAWGEVIGVNSAIASQSGDFSGVSFAVPSDLMVKVVSSLIRDGSYEHPWLGLAGADMTPAIAEAMRINYSRGLLVTSVAPGSPVLKGGIRAGNKIMIVDGQRLNIGGDVIIGVDNVNVTKLEDLLVYVEYARKPHDLVTLKIDRNNESMSVVVELENRPPPT